MIQIIGESSVRDRDPSTYSIDELYANSVMYKDKVKVRVKYGCTVLEACLTVNTDAQETGSKYIKYYFTEQDLECLVDQLEKRYAACGVQVTLKELKNSKALQVTDKYGKVMVITLKPDAIRPGLIPLSLKHMQYGQVPKVLEDLHKVIKSLDDSTAAYRGLEILYQV